MQNLTLVLISRYYSRWASPCKVKSLVTTSPDWENGYGRTKLDSAHVQVTDKNHFSITPNGDGTLDP